MLSYRAPSADWKLLANLLAPAFLPSAYEQDADLWIQVIDSASKFHEEVLAPLAGSGDQEGARFEQGNVFTPAGYRQAWDAYVEAGWLGASLPQHAGGWELPKFLHIMLSEMRASCAHSWAMYGSFCAPAAHMLLQVGDEWMKKWVVPHLATGKWTATMCLTEAHCGSDLRQLRTQAWQDEDGHWCITGTKTFISGGDQDLSENIMHVVLARDMSKASSPKEGLENVHVFLVPKFLVNREDGTLGERNAVQVQSIEEKMGIEASATCTLHFDASRAWLLQAPTVEGRTVSGMAPMFTMMNYARASTASSSVGHVHLAYQNAVAYAQERMAGRNRQGQTLPILAHRDVQRLLWGARSFAEGGRAALMLFALWQDDAEKRNSKLADDHRCMHELLTPVFKAFFTDEGFDHVNACMQVYGGHGYVKDYGIEQLVRNARIGQIYEGTNGIQSIDFVQRKLLADGWRGFDVFHNHIKRCFENAPLQHQTWMTSGMQQCLAVLTCIRVQLPKLEKDDLLAVAYDVLQAVGLTLIAYAWVQVLTALEGHQDVDVDNMYQKTNLAKHWFVYRVSLLKTLQHRIEAAMQNSLHLHLRDF